MKNAYIVQGVGESTGCRFMTDILIKCGCNGKSGHVQDFQNFMFNYDKFVTQLRRKNYNKFVCRFSYPHGTYLPDIKYQHDILKDVGYDNVYCIFTTRSQLCQHIGTDKGQHLINNPIKELPTIADRMTFAYKHVFGRLKDIDQGSYTNFVVVNMGDILHHPKGNLKFILNRIDLKLPDDFDFSFIKRDADKKRIDSYFK